jgi:hypothetical protein
LFFPDKILTPLRGKVNLKPTFKPAFISPYPRQAFCDKVEENFRWAFGSGVFSQGG